MKKILLALAIVCGTHSFAQKMNWTVFSQKTKKIYTEVESCPADYPRQEETIDYYCFKNFEVVETGFSLDAGKVRHIVQSEESGAIWFASYEYGVLKYANSKFSNYTKQTDLFSNQIRSLAQKDNVGLLAFSQEGVSYIGPLPNVNDHLPEIFAGGAGIIDKNDAMWIGYLVDGLWKSNGPDYTTWSQIGSEASGDLPKFSGITFIYEHSKTGNIWVREYLSGIYEYNGTEWIHHSDIPAFTSGDLVYKPFEDSKGNLWIRTSVDLYQYDGSEWHEFNMQNTTLKSNSTVNIFEDSHQNLWVMTDKDISVYDGNGWLSYDVPGTTSNVSGYRNLITEDAYGNIWAATNSGLLFFDGYKWTKFTTDNSPLPDNNVITLFRDQENKIWVGSESGLSYIEETGPNTSIPHSLSGYTFLDKQNDNVFDKQSEPAIPNRKLLLLPANIYTYSNDLGYFQFHVTAPGVYTIKPADDAAFNSKGEITVTVNGLNTKANVPYTAGTEQTDLIAFSTANGIPRCFGNVNYWINVKNQGNSDFNGKLSFEPDPSASFMSSSLQPSAVLPTKITWENFTVPAFQSKQISLVVNLPGIEYMGQNVQFNINAENESTHNIYRTQIVNKIICAYDPNDKSVVPDRDEIVKTDELEYLIRFQNTGNDTAFTVILKDTISPLLDRESVEIISSSHSCQTTIDPATGEMIVTFDNIRLPDDKINEPMSHGYVKYKVSQKQNIPLLSEIKNTAYIYFDRNPAIVTNTINQVLVEEAVTGVSESRSNKNAVAYPNPAKDLLHFQDKEGKVLLFNQLGKLVAEGNTDVPLNVSGLSDGMYFLHQLKEEGTIIQKIEITK